MIPGIAKEFQLSFGAIFLFSILLRVLLLALKLNLSVLIFFYYFYIAYYFYEFSKGEILSCAQPAIMI